MQELFNTADFFKRFEFPFAKKLTSLPGLFEGTTTILQMLWATFSKKATNAH